MKIDYSLGKLQLGKISDALGVIKLNGRILLAGRESWDEGTWHMQRNTSTAVSIECSFSSISLNIVIDWKALPDENQVEERVTITNLGDTNVQLERLDIGLSFAAPTNDWRVVALPFVVQPNSLEYDLPMERLLAGKVKSPDYRTDCPYWPSTCDGDELRSEAWLLCTQDRGLLVIKYNPCDIEFSMLAARDGILRIGGAGFSLYHEPQKATMLAPGTDYAFGITRYKWLEDLNPVQSAQHFFYDFLESMGHGIPDDYDPPVHWNELYDIGWYHSDPAKLATNYTREALLAEAEKARECHAEALYLDPGWEIFEGSTIWDEARLGPIEAFIADLYSMGLKLSFRTVLRDYKGWIPEKWIVQHDERDLKPGSNWANAIPPFREGCLIDEGFRAEKLSRVLKPILAGAAFLMVDEHDWRGPCHEPAHGHDDPSTAAGHANAVYDYCNAIRTATRETTGRDVLIETHDPVWPWANRYCPVYFRQGFDDAAAFSENWGFEFMWNPILDLRLGKAISLYHYASACPIPLYLHINMSHDNEHCLFFWWAASTVRHLGIGGKTCNATVCQTNMVHEVDTEEHFKRCKEAMEEYIAWKPYFVRGQFIGINEDVHLHVLAGISGGVIVAFNIDFEPRSLEFDVVWPWINASVDTPLEIKAVNVLTHDVQSSDEGLHFTVQIDVGCPARIYMTRSETGD
ncbi:MAG TPA: hypothetical protein VKM55_27280 [Candidatus Lokiarchaeia archaeon]|nr:hypothetical protein [Candidatus Lokiarchaeia archaeon]